jgi:DNA-binding CsgD family transcriptional regulator
VNKLLPVAPAIALSGLIDRLDERRLAYPSLFRDIGNRLNELQHRFVQSNRVDRSVGATVLTDRRVTLALSGAVNSLGRSQIMTWNTGPYSLVGPTRSMVDITVSPDSRLVDRIRFRSIYGSYDVGIPGMTDSLALLHEAGQHVRISERIPMKLIIADDDIAMIPLVPNGWSAVLITDAALVSMLRTFFEAVWERAQPYGVPASNKSRSGELAGIDRQIVDLLAAAYKDEAIARQLNLSVRTVRRHISEICESLGASNRFAAAVAAARAGWLTAPSGAPAEGER